MIYFYKFMDPHDRVRTIFGIQASFCIIYGEIVLRRLVDVEISLIIFADLNEKEELLYLPFKPAPIISNPITNFISQNLFHNIFILAGKTYRTLSRKLFWREDLPSYYYTYDPQLTKDFKKAWKIEEKLLREIKKQADNIKAKFLVVTLYSREQVTNFKFLKEAGYSSVIKNFKIDFPMQKITPILEKQEIEYIHLYPLVLNISLEKPEELFYHHDAHWNEKGHNLSAEFVFEALIQKALIPINE